MNIRISEVRLQDNGKPLKAFIDAEVNGILIRNIRVIQESGKRLWVATPQSSWKDKATGAIRYKTLITFPDDIKGELDRLTLNAYHLERRKIGKPENITV